MAVPPTTASTAVTIAIVSTFLLFMADPFLLTQFRIPPLGATDTRVRHCHSTSRDEPRPLHDGVGAPLKGPVRSTPAPASFHTDKSPPCRPSPRLLVSPG